MTTTSNMAMRTARLWWMGIRGTLRIEEQLRRFIALGSVKRLVHWRLHRLRSVAATVRRAYFCGTYLDFSYTSMPILCIASRMIWSMGTMDEGTVPSPFCYSDDWVVTMVSASRLRYASFSLTIAAIDRRNWLALLVQVAVTISNHRI